LKLGFRSKFFLFLTYFHRKKSENKLITILVFKNSVNLLPKIVEKST
jgi:hypothetical protein